LEILSGRSRVEGPLAAWVWDRRGARIEGDLRGQLLQERHAGDQLLEVVVRSELGAAHERLEAVLKALGSLHHVRYRILQVGG